MNALVLTTVLTLLAQSIAPQESTEHLCAAPALVGTWQWMKSGGEAPSGDGSMHLKHVTPTHFFVLSIDAN
jgi:hypothetical protein